MSSSIPSPFTVPSNENDEHGSIYRMSGPIQCSPDEQDPNPISIAGIRNSQALALSQPLRSTNPNSLADFNELELLKKDAEILKFKIAEESKKILEHYSDFIMRVHEILQMKKVDHRLVQMKTLHMGQFSSSEPCMPKVEEAKDLTGVMIAFHHYTSWFNYELTKKVAKDFGGKEGEAAIADYEKKLKDFMGKLIVESPHLQANHKLPSQMQEFTMKIEEKYETATLQDLVLIKAKAVKLFEIEPHRLILKSVKKGCILTTWWVPSADVTNVYRALMTKNLSKLKVISFSIIGKVFDVNANPHIGKLSQSPSVTLRAFDFSHITSGIDDKRISSASSQSESTLTSNCSSPTLSDRIIKSSQKITKGQYSFSAVNLSMTSSLTSSSELEMDMYSQYGHNNKTKKQYKKEHNKQGKLKRVKKFFQQCKGRKFSASTSKLQTHSSSDESLVMSDNSVEASPLHGSDLSMDGGQNGVERQTEDNFPQTSVEKPTINEEATDSTQERTASFRRRSYSSTSADLQKQSILLCEGTKNTAPRRESMFLESEQEKYTRDQQNFLKVPAGCPSLHTLTSSSGIGSMCSSTLTLCNYCDNSSHYSSSLCCYCSSSPTTYCAHNEDTSVDEIQLSPFD